MLTILSKLDKCFEKMSIYDKTINYFKSLKEKRGYARRSSGFSVKIKLESLEEFFTEYITDISAGGVFIATSEPYERGSVVDVEFSLKDEIKHFFKVRGVVVRVHDENEDSAPQLPVKGMGIKFIEITEQSRNLMKTLLEQASKESLIKQ